MDQTHRRLFALLGATDADIGLRRMLRRVRDTGFVPFEPEYALEAFYHLLGQGRLRPGARLLDLGAGTGNIVAVAAVAGLNADGIEIDKGLVYRARRKIKTLRSQGLLPAEVSTHVVWGNYLPQEYFTAHRKGESIASRYEDRPLPPRWRTHHGGDPYGTLGAEPSSFDSFFCYAWQQQVPSVCEFFSRYARPDAVLLCAAWDLPERHEEMLRKLGLEYTIDPYLDGERWRAEGSVRRLPIYEFRKTPQPNV